MKMEKLGSLSTYQPIIASVTFHLQDLSNILLKNLDYL